MPGTETRRQSGVSFRSSRARLRRWRRVGFPLAAVLLGLSPFVLLEIGLWLFNVGNPDAYVDPFVGFSRVRPLFQLDQDAGFYRTAASRELFFGTQQFAAEKPPNGFRVFALGGSTVRGRPYQTETSFVKWLQLELSGHDPTQQFETVNCGGLSYASYRLMPILEEVLHYEPDLIILATGHNEFLEDRTYGSVKSRSAARAWIEDRVYSLRTITLLRQLRGSAADDSNDQSGKTILAEEVEARLDSRSGYASYHRDENWRAQVLAHFDQTMRAMIDACRKTGVPLLLVKLGSNLRDCPPFKSEHKAGLSSEDELVWQSAFDAATKVEQNDCKQALRLYRQAGKLDGDHALLAYRIAGCLDRLGRHAQARGYFIKAKDLDVCPLRFLEDMDGMQHAISEATQTPLVDARQVLQLSSPAQIPGNNFYVDHVHPTIGAHQMIAQAILSKMKTLRLLGGQSEWQPSLRRRAYRSHLKQLGPIYFANGRRRVGWLENWASRKRHLQESLPRDVRGFLHAGHRHVDFGDFDRAWEYYNSAISQQPSAVRSILDHGRRLFEQGRSTSARHLVEWLRESSSHECRVEIELARLILALEEDDTNKAAEIFAAYRTALKKLTTNSSRWLSVMPDALQRAEVL